MRRLLFTALIVFFAINAFSQHYRNFNSEYVVLTEQIDSEILEKHLQYYESKIKKLFKKNNRHLSKDSVQGIINNTFYYYVCCYEIVHETQDTIYLKPYYKQIIKYFKILHNNLEIGSYGSLGNQTKKDKCGAIRLKVIDKSGLNYSYLDVAYSSWDLYNYEQLFAKNIFAIKDYCEDNYQYDFFWFYRNSKGRLEKIYNLDVK